jgi:hypothetical protein
LSGRLTRASDGFTLSLRDIAGGGLPFEVEGTLTNTTLQLRALMFDPPRPQSPGRSIEDD